jgi:predicted chitinase
MTGPSPAATEQARAMVAGWQQTVNVLWHQRAGQAPPGGGITIEVLRAVMPTLAEGKAQEYLPLLNSAMAEAQINTPQRQAAFLAQIAHESGELKYFEEIASGKAYEGRKDLGNTEPGDGRRYKGRGPIQLTGRANYRKAGGALGLPLEADPPLAARPDVGFRTAGWFWNSRDLNRFADSGDFREITRRINGGTRGLEARERYYAKAKEALGI